MNEYAAHYDDGAAAIRALNVALIEALADSARAVERIQDIGRTLPLEGRPIGSWITTAIRRTLGDARLAATAGDAAAWLLTYTEAARAQRCACPSLAPDLVRHLRNVPPALQQP
jgi:hypothetical protein